MAVIIRYTVYVWGKMTVKTFKHLTFNRSMQIHNTLLFGVRSFHVEMADYKCFECEEKFPTEKLILSHLKIEHHHKDNYKMIKCVINLTECENVCRSTFLTFGGLRKHLKVCIKKRKMSAACGSNDINQVLNNDSAGPFAGIDDVFELFGDVQSIDQV